MNAPTKIVRTTIDLDRDLHRRLRITALLAGTTMSAYVRKLVEVSLEHDPDERRD